jgi:hypothetical protein
LFWPIIFVAIYIAHPPSASPPPDDAVYQEIKTKCASVSLDCLQTIASKLPPSMAQGAILGLIGLLIQLWWRGEWPTGQMNAGRPKMLDPMALVTVTVAAMVAGLSAGPFLSSKLSALGVVAVSYLAADAATLGVDKISELAQKIKAFFQSRSATK